MMKLSVNGKFGLIITVICINLAMAKENITRESGCVTGQPQTSNQYYSTKWYLDSAEKTALYNQAFHTGLEKIATRVQQLKPKKWGVIFDVDETLLNNMEFDKNEIVQKCKVFNYTDWYKFLAKESSVATPGAVTITCRIKELGGYVALVTNRSIVQGINIKAATIANLKKSGICFDTILFADKNTKNDKNSRFEAIISGNYTNLTYTNKLPKMNVIAYFGDNIQDFPHLKQSDAIHEDPGGAYFNKFGEEYFILPNPVYGSWTADKFP